MSRRLLSAALVVAAVCPATAPAQPVVRERSIEPLEVAPGVDLVKLPATAWKGGAMARLSGDRVLLVAGSEDVSAPNGGAKLVGFVSADGGKTWAAPRVLLGDPAYNTGRPTLLRTRAGKLWLVYYGLSRSGEGAARKTRSDLYVTSSADEGETWQPPRRLFEGYTAGQRSAIETSKGHLVIAFSYAADKTGRNASAALVSADDGKTWKRSAALDLPGRGSHSGALEPAVVELKDGRLWMVIRHGTNFQQSFSEDGGLTWGAPAPTTVSQPVPLGGAPASVIRLQSGKLAMAWNPKVEVPPGASDWAKHGRGQLAVALSDDDGKSWGKPLVCARAASVTYPHLLEAAPGQLLLTTGLMKATDPATGKSLRMDTVVLRLTEARLADPK